MSKTERGMAEARRVGFVAAGEEYGASSTHYHGCPQWNETGDRTCDCLPSVYVTRHRDGAVLIVRDTPRPGDGGYDRVGNAS